ncbi:hypothetical protein GBA52_027976 [Prunus armeniaca]|nr:hypothetical protein GBA52_027976 [Prunus armeniaca]
MDCFVGFAHAPATAIFRRPVTYTTSRTYRNGGLRLRAKLVEENDPLLQSALDSASLRFRETHRPGKPVSSVFDTFLFQWEPLFVDPYAGCFVAPNAQMNMKQSSDHYCLATKFIDDKLLRTVNHIDGLKQVVVLLTDGMDTRPYRLSWPTSTIIFNISPERVFKRAAEKLQDGNLEEGISKSRGRRGRGRLRRALIQCHDNKADEMSTRRNPQPRLEPYHKIGTWLSWVFPSENQRAMS